MPPSAQRRGPSRNAPQPQPRLANRASPRTAVTATGAPARMAPYARTATAAVTATRCLRRIPSPIQVVDDDAAGVVDTRYALRAVVLGEIGQRKRPPAGACAGGLGEIL